MRCGGAGEHLTADLLRRMIATTFGTLDRATLKLLDGLARRDRSRTAERNLKIGTVLVHDYQGRRHTVTVAPEGYVWEGQPYSSLSAIARAITGTAWSGPRFFALKSAAEQWNSQAHNRGIAQHHTQSQLSAWGEWVPAPRNPTGALARPKPTDPQE